MFDSTKEALSQLLNDIHAGKTQLPDFQRGWIWDDEHIRSLLASVSVAYPIGAVMMLEAGNPNVAFQPRTIEGVNLGEHVAYERLILDGQQRLTSLYQALMLSDPVATRDSKGNDLDRHYYLDIERALNPHEDRVDAIVGVPRSRVLKTFDRKVTADASTRELEYEHELFPLSIVFDTVAFTEWTNGYLNYGESNRLERWSKVFSTAIRPFQEYQVPLILLRRDTPKAAVCQVFEKVNTGGVSLTVFELLTATFAIDNFSLRDDWGAHEKRLHEHSQLTGVQSTDFLQAITLVAAQDRRAHHDDTGAEHPPPISCKRKDVLELALSEYRRWSSAITGGFIRAAKLLTSEKIFSAADVPYRTQIVPLAATLAALGNRSENADVRERLRRWLWCGVFGELYGASVESRFARDLPQLLAWIDGGPEPDSVVEANFTPERLRTLRSRQSAAYKGVYALLMRSGSEDFLSGVSVNVQTYYDERIDIHHIFPRAWCEREGIAATTYNSVINKTPLSARTNRMMGGGAPSDYLQAIQQKGLKPERVDEILSSHLIAPDLLRGDEFERFLDDREAALLAAIEGVMGKPVLTQVHEQQGPVRAASVVI